MGLYRDISVSKLKNQALLDQHRTCHSFVYLFRIGKHNNILSDIDLAETLSIHLITVKEMLRRGMQHTSSLYRGRADFLPLSRLSHPTILVRKTHPQMINNARCPICTKIASIRLSKVIFGVWECRHCMQRFTSLKENLALFANANSSSDSSS